MLSLKLLDEGTVVVSIDIWTDILLMILSHAVKVYWSVSFFSIIRDLNSLNNQSVLSINFIRMNLWIANGNLKETCKKFLFLNYRKFAHQPIL